MRRKNSEKSKIEFSSEDIAGNSNSSSSRRMRSFSGEEKKKKDGEKKKSHRKGFVLKIDRV